MKSVWAVRRLFWTSLLWSFFACSARATTSIDCRMALERHRAEFMAWAKHAGLSGGQVVTGHLVKHAQALLDASGVIYRVGTYPDRQLLRVEPSRDSALNRFALDMKLRYGAYVHFDPQRAFDTDAYSLVDFVLDENSVVGYALVLPWSAVAESGQLNFWENPVLAHEVEHLEILRLIDHRQDSPYYGWLYAEESVPGYPGPYAAGYQTNFDVSELRTYQAQIMAELAELRQLLPERTHPNVKAVRRNHWRAIRLNVRRLYRLAQTVKATLSVVKPTEEWYEPEDGSVVQGVLTSPDRKVWLTIPLVHSQGASDAGNPTYLKNQVSALSKVTRGLIHRLAAAESEVAAPVPTAVGMARLQVRLTTGQPQLFQPPALKAP